MSRLERDRVRALVRGGPGWVPVVTMANVALARRHVPRRATCVLPPARVVPLPRWNLGRAAL